MFLWIPSLRQRCFADLDCLSNRSKQRDILAGVPVRHGGHDREKGCCNGSSLQTQVLTGKAHGEIRGVWQNYFASTLRAAGIASRREGKNGVAFSTTFRIARSLWHDPALRIARRRGGKTLKELGRCAGGMDYAAVSEAIRTFERARLKTAVVRHARRRACQYLNLET
jgi:hypothetical protein